MYQNRTRINAASFSRKYLLDCGTILRRLGRLDGAFYFYPRGVEGFIESCVLCTQRELDSEGERDMLMYRDLQTAMGVWQDHMEENFFRSGKGSMRDDLAAQRDEINTALNLGAKIDDFVLSKMRVVRDVHGDFSLDPREFEWANRNALIVSVHF